MMIAPIEPILNQFNKLMRSYVTFNTLYLSLALIELVLLIIFFTFLAKSAILALSLAIVFLTFFSYFVLRMYLQAKKSDQFLALLHNFVNACKNQMSYQEGRSEHHHAIAKSCCNLADALHGRENEFYSPFQRLTIIKPYLQKFSCWCHWEDVFKMKELLLQYAVEEHIKMVKCEPTNLEVHAALANAYVMLSGLYVDPSKIDNAEESRGMVNEKIQGLLEQKFRSTAQRAIEEFKILKDFAPDDPWVHAQLAYSYRDLKMPKEEIQEYEAILRLCPDDMDTLYKLGLLYYQQGHNAQGMRVYEQLKGMHPNKAESLIKYYGAYAPFST